MKEYRERVAQNCILLFRRIEFGGPKKFRVQRICVNVTAFFGPGRPAECDSAIRQITNLRYCALLTWFTRIDSFDAGISFIDYVILLSHPKLPLMKTNQNELNGKQSRAMRNLFVGALSLLMAVAWAGCKPAGNATTEKAGKTSAEVNPAGTYALVSVNGKNVPCAVEHEGHSLTVNSGSFVIDSDGICSSKTVFSPPSGNPVTREVKASYTREGSKLTMQWQGAGMTTGTVQDDTFTMNNEGMVFAYRK
jgi:hypothetical protein